MSSGWREYMSLLIEVLFCDSFCPSWPAETPTIAPQSIEIIT
jgi:hypothetical protein